MTDAGNSLALSVLKEIRADLRQHREILLQLAEPSQRHDRRFYDIDRRIGESRAAIELMLKSELPGRPTHFERLASAK